VGWLVGTETARHLPYWSSAAPQTLYSKELFFMKNKAFKQKKCAATIQAVAALV